MRRQKDGASLKIQSRPGPQPNHACPCLVKGGAHGETKQTGRPLSIGDVVLRKKMYGSF